MRANGMAGLVQRAEIRPVHVTRPDAGPADSDEKSRSDASRRKDRSSKTDVGDMPVVEGNLGVKARANAGARVRVKLCMLLEPCCRDDVGVACSIAAQLMIKQKKPACERLLALGRDEFSTQKQLRAPQCPWVS